MIIDKSKFDTSELIQAVRIQSKLVGRLMKDERVIPFLISRSGIKTVQPVPDGNKEYRLVLLRERFPRDLLCEFEAEDASYELRLGYDDLSAEEAMRRLLPDNSDLPTSFETIGHIAHMNLREEYLDHKQVIGQVIIDKNPHIDTVITKIGTLANEFRTFEKEVIACRNGKKSLVASVSENKMCLTVDYERCYWNSRLSTERTRLLKSFTSSADTTRTRLIDMCCGVGALACFGARAGLEVFANDLNPWAVACARQNALKNKVDIELYNLDAREFLRSLVKEGKLSEPRTNHVMINLPEIGLSFLDAFRDLFDSEDEMGGNVFQVYCHCFSREDPPQDARCRALTALGLDGKDSLIELSTVYVRDVSPNKVMYSVEFRVPAQVLVRRPSCSAKKPRVAHS